MNNFTEEQIVEARHWIAESFPVNPLDASDTHPVYEESAEYVQRYVQRHCIGGWPAFVADCCP
jgi:hypothetical protein